MTVIRVVLLEDNTIDALKVQIILDEAVGNYRYVLVGIFDTLPPLLEYLQKHEVDIVVADIFINNWPVGLDLLKHLSSQHFPVIFMTSSHDKAVYVKAQQQRSVYYLVKPFHALTLQSTLEKALEEYEQSKQYDFLDNKFLYLNGLTGKYEKVRFEQIIYLTSANNHCYIFSNTQKYMVKKSLTKLLTQYLGNDFIRIHQQYVVNKQHLKAINHDTVTITGGLELPIGKSFKKDIIVFRKTT